MSRSAGRRRGSLFAVAIAATLSAGCLGPGTTQSVRYYVLSAVLPEKPSTASRARVGIMPVRLPGYLDRSELTVRRGAEIVPLTYAAWAAPLDREFARVLAQNLVRALPDHEVVLFPWRRGLEPAYRLVLDVERFDIENDQAVLHARWRKLTGDEREASSAKLSRISVPVAGEGDLARVAALSAALAELSVAIALAIDM